MEIKGKIVNVLPMQTGQGKNGEWRKQDYIVEYNLDSQYPKKMLFNLWGDKIDQFQIQEGQMVKVDFDVDCREFNGRWFNDIRAWRVEKETTASAVSSTEMAPPPFSATDIPAESGDDLPF